MSYLDKVIVRVIQCLQVMLRSILLEMLWQFRKRRVFPRKQYLHSRTHPCPLSSPSCWRGLPRKEGPGCAGKKNVGVFAVILGETPVNSSLPLLVPSFASVSGRAGRDRRQGAEMGLWRSCWCFPEFSLGNPASCPSGVASATLFPVQLQFLGL